MVCRRPGAIPLFPSPYNSSTSFSSRLCRVEAIESVNTFPFLYTAASQQSGKTCARIWVLRDSTFIGRGCLVPHLKRGCKGPRLLPGALGVSPNSFFFFTCLFRRRRNRQVKHDRGSSSKSLYLKGDSPRWPDCFFSVSEIYRHR